MHANSVPDDLLHALRDRRVAHLCIHNQYCYRLRDTAAGSRDRDTMTRFGDTLAVFTNTLAAYVPTVNVQFDIDAFNTMPHAYTEKFDHQPQQRDYYPDRFYAYDGKAMTIMPDAALPSRGHYIDLINAQEACDQHVFIDDGSNIFTGTHGADLTRFMQENGWDTVLGSGLYSPLRACVGKSLSHAALNGFTAYAVTDRIFTHPKDHRAHGHQRIIDGYRPEIRRVDSAAVLRLAMNA